MRRQDLSACYVVIAPQGARNPEMYGRKATIAHGLQVTAEKDDGIILNGMKLLGTGAPFSDDLGRQPPAAAGRPEGSGRHLRGADQREWRHAVDLQVL